MKLVVQMRSRWFGAGVGVLLGVVAIFCGGTAATAQGSVDAETACTPDVMSLCNEAIPDRGKIVACLRSKRTQVSLTCRQAMGKQGGSSRKKRRATR
jgi:hypothetical protein